MLKTWIRRQNLYLWATGLGLFGIADAMVPGPPADRLIGLAIAFIAAWVWLN